MAEPPSDPAGDPGRGPARGLDTNVLVRYVVADDDAQHAAAARLIEGACSPEAPGLVHPVALCELVWVLRRAYKVPKAEVVAALRLLLSVRTLRVLDEPLVREAVGLYAGGEADFADALLHAAYRAAGSALATFDRAAAALPGAALLTGLPPAAAGPPGDAPPDRGSDRGSES